MSKWKREGEKIHSQMPDGFPSFLRLNSIPLDMHTPFSFSTHLSMHSWVVSMLGYCDW